MDRRQRSWRRMIITTISASTPGRAGAQHPRRRGIRASTTWPSSTPPANASRLARRLRQVPPTQSRRDGGRSSTSTTRSRSPVGHSVQQFGRPAFGIGELRAERVERDIEGGIVGHRAFGASDLDGGIHLFRADRRRRPHGDAGHRARLDVVSAGKPVGGRVEPLHRPDPSKSRSSARSSPALPLGRRTALGDVREPTFGAAEVALFDIWLRQFGTSRPRSGARDAQGFGLIADRYVRPLSVRALCGAAAGWSMPPAAGLVSGPAGTYAQGSGPECLGRRDGAARARPGRPGPKAHVRSNTLGDPRQARLSGRRPGYSGVEPSCQSARCAAVGAWPKAPSHFLCLDNGVPGFGGKLISICWLHIWRP